jgi:DNA-binding response OmpR family regulator
MTRDAHLQPVTRLDEEPAGAELRRVLVADDDEDLRRAVRATLELDGWTVLEARTGTQALSLAREERLSVIFLDCRMPGISGQEVYRELRAAGVSTPVLLVTARLDVKEAAAELGVRDYLGKPFGVDALCAALDGAAHSGSAS